MVFNVENSGFMPVFLAYVVPHQGVGSTWLSWMCNSLYLRLFASTAAILAAAISGVTFTILPVRV